MARFKKGSRMGEEKSYFGCLVQCCHHIHSDWKMALDGSHLQRTENSGFPAHIHILLMYLNVLCVPVWKKNLRLYFNITFSVHVQYLI